MNLQLRNQYCCEKNAKNMKKLFMVRIFFKKIFYEILFPSMANVVLEK